MLNKNINVIKDESTNNISNNISSIKSYKDVQTSTTKNFLNDRSEMKNRNNIDGSKTIHLTNSKDSNNTQTTGNKVLSNNINVFSKYKNKTTKTKYNNHTKIINNRNIYKNVKIKKLSSNANIPTLGTNNSAGYDLIACIDTDIQIQPNEIVIVPTGIAIEIPIGYFGMVCSRSGLACKYGIHVLNSPGIIDSDYRGEIKCILHNCSNNTFTLSNGTKMAQLIIMKYEKINWIETDHLSDTNRGTNGFGSTGMNI